MRKYKSNGGFRTPLQSIVSTDDLRPNGCCVHIQNGFVYATNYHILIKQNLRTVHQFDEETITVLEGKAIDYRVLEVLWKAQKVVFTKKHIWVLHKSGIEQTLNYENYDMPNMERTLSHSLAQLERGNNEISSIKIDPALYSILSHGLLGEIFNLQFTGEQKSAIVVDTNEFDILEQVGLIMPVQI